MLYQSEDRGGDAGAPHGYSLPESILKLKGKEKRNRAQTCRRMKQLVDLIIFNLQVILLSGELGDPEDGVSPTLLIDLR